MDDPKPETLAEVSPTGKPMVSAKLAPYFAAAAAICTVVAGAAKIPGLHLPDEVFGYAALLALCFGTLLGTTPGLRKMVVVLCVASIMSCATPAIPFMVSGQAIMETRADYHSTLELMDQAFGSGVMTKEQFHEWRIFADYFARSFELVVQAWLLAHEASDAVREQRLLVDINDLISRLKEMTNTVLGLLGKGVAK